MLNEKQLISLRKYLEEQLSNYTGNEKRKIDIDPNILEKIIFKNILNTTHKVFALYEDLIQKLDLSDISFDNFNAYQFDFGELYGVKLNPQTVHGKDLRHSILEGVEIIGSFDNCMIHHTNFKGSTGAKINPQSIYEKDLSYSILDGVEITGPFDNCKIVGTDFTGSTGAKINPQTIYEKDLSFANLSGVEIIESLDDCIIDCANFTNSKNMNREEYEDCLQKIKKSFK